MAEPVLYRKGLNKALDLATVRAAQMDASKILSTLPNFFSSSLDQFASSAVEHLGFPSAVMNIEAQVVKLLLFEKGDHQSCPFDQDAKPGNKLTSFPLLLYFIFILNCSIDFRHCWHDASPHSMPRWPQGRHRQVESPWNQCGRQHI